MSNKYEHIKTVDELEKALLYIKAEQKATERSLHHEAARLMNSLRPSNLLNNLFPSSFLADAGLGLVQGLRRFLAGGSKAK